MWGQSHWRPLAASVSPSSHYLTFFDHLDYFTMVGAVLTDEAVGNIVSNPDVKPLNWDGLPSATASWAKRAAPMAPMTSK